MADAPLSWHKSLKEKMETIGGRPSLYGPSVIVFSATGRMARPGEGRQRVASELGVLATEEVEAPDIQACEETTGIAVLFVDDILLCGRADFLDEKIRKNLLRVRRWQGGAE